jgi:hypothetical protein
MSMQIKAIVLYNQKGDVRRLDFKTGHVNIITGKSGTGKSALLHIVEFCLGKSDFNIPEGRIRDTVAWYAVLYDINETLIFIAKPAPAQDALSQSSVYLKIGGLDTIPAFSELVTNTNDTAVVDELSRWIGISPNLNIPVEGQSRNPLEANIKHTHFYLFQEQSLIASERTLFHQQSEQFIPQAIKDTFPYFLGAVKENQLELDQKLRLAHRELRLAQRNLREAEDIVSDTLSRGQTLIAEAQQVGLLPVGSIPSKSSEIIDLLNETKSWHPGDLSPVADNLLPQLEVELQNYRQEFRQIKEQISMVESFSREAGGYLEEAGQQGMRLEAINIVEENNNSNTCPLCSSKLSHEVPTILEIRKNLNQLSNNLFTVNKERPRLIERTQNLNEQLARTRVEIENRQKAIQAVLTEQNYGDEIRDTNARIAHVAGRISLYLETVQQIDENYELKAKVEQKKTEVEQLEKLVNPEETDMLIESKQNIISSYMTDWAKYLQLEYQDYRYRFDLQKLTVIVDRPDRPIPMERMGSGENWLGCHLITLLSIHKFFRQQNRPVPGFIFFDQPSQNYFINENAYKSLEGQPGEVEQIKRDADFDAVQRMFDLFFQVCGELANNFQIIVTEHANLGDERFQDALIEKPWTDGRALIPSSWFE